ncbi:DNA cytosine methyltransferase [Alkaliphilus sp. B6464]|uniref:DNA cytosine methyltransferase n=1 Tax=Alkaliphilus sp. B6464 TaxID=2731219 RepID=UPI001BA5C45F|nr:DNA cytosine methyltransferase [Alkaliphilus sp. B6464]QUH21252.1 DNA cytosine methyltransferase [Alkaliphilus sp. B6464]
MSYRIIDLFAGMGGFRIAFENQGCECVFSSEIDKYARETYKENFGEYPSGDITKISSDEIPDFDILCAGFPCQPFSIGGLRLGFEDSRGTLFFEVARIIKEKRPSCFILENVKGLVNHDSGNTLKTIESILDEIGYNFSYKILNALDYGIPQNRERWYCIGFKKELEISFNESSRECSRVFNFPKTRELKFFVEDIIEENVIGYDCTAKATENINIHLPVFVEKNGKIQDRVIIANEIRPSRCSFKNNGTIPCFTAKMGTGGNNVPVIVDYNRKLTERECLRLMGFPESYKIKPNSHQSYKQIGNSVVVPIIEELANRMIELLKKVE